MRVGLLVADPAWEEARAGSAPRDRLLHSMTRQEKTVAAVRAALGALGHTAVDIRVDEGLAGALRAAGVDVVFNTYFGPGTRHDQPAVAAVMEWVGVPFSGGGAACHYVGLSKPLTKRLLVAEGLPTPRFVSGGDAASLRAAGIELPVIVKAPGEGEGIGIDESSVARTDGELAAARERIAREFATEALVEELMPGREVTVGVIEGATPVVTPQEAFYSAKLSLPLDEAVGRVCAEFVMCYPPGIPILAPGELITRDIVEYIRYAKDRGGSLTGPEDLGLERLNVLRV